MTAPTAFLTDQHSRVLEFYPLDDVTFKVNQHYGSYILPGDGGFGAEHKCGGHAGEAGPNGGGH